MYWFKYETWDYMDEVPSIGYQMFDSVATAKEWAEHLTENYSGGPTRIIGPARQEEVLKFVKDNELELDSETLSNINNKSYYLNN